MVAVTCTAEDEAEVIMWRDGHGCDDAADDVDGPTKMELGEPAMQQSVEVRGADMCLRQQGGGSATHPGFKDDERLGHNNGLRGEERIL